ncbi:rhodanese-like domain-containing protein [Bacillus sp. EAC]|uniref:rhodanese-like domain-containing protein n=1 Tax=Bacillus sp. EAC TaxID=1978338 RepID=UPI00277D12AB|nr:rhodanese-like domain-containing protein [Bacillus sp. EAC]
MKNELKTNSIQLIDVRTPEEYKGRHIKQFRNIPLNQLKNVSDLSTDKKTIVICQSGVRSKKACKILKKMGFISLTNVKGGMSTW